MRNKDKLAKVFAWTSFGLAIVGGAALPLTFVGDLVRNVVGWLPGWVATTAFVVGLAIVVLDLAMDGIPNKPAIYLMMIVPSVGTAIPGQLSSTVRGWSNTAMEWFSSWTGTWLGTTSVYVLAGVGIAVSLVFAQRTVQDRRA